MIAKISRAALDAILCHAAANGAEEACGLLLGERRERRVVEARPAANISAQPRRAFEIDPAALFDAYRQERAGGPEVLGNYHSHPGGRALPSQADADGALEPGRIWIIVADGEVRAFVAGAGDGVAGRFTRLDLEIEET